MTARRLQIRYNIICFALLFSVSFYRQMSLRFLPGDPFRTWILYGCYVALLSVWHLGIRARIVQKNIRHFLLAEDFLMLFCLTIRFVQDTFWYENIPLMRVSGLFLAAMILPIITLGLFASLCVGKWDDYQLPRRWFLLLMPTLIMAILTVMDEKLHFVNYIIPDEPQPNLNFHPYIGSFLILVIGLTYACLRVWIIFNGSQLMIHGRLRQMLISAFEPILVVISLLGFFLGSLNIVPGLERVEVLEMYAKIYYIEILTWELYIYLGLVPTNSDYEDIFMNATIEMQLITRDGRHLTSRTAEPVSEDLLELLKSEKSCTVDDHHTFSLYENEDGYLIWNKDLSAQLQAIRELDQAAEALTQEGDLLKEEFRLRNEEAHVSLQNEIYDDLTRQVNIQLRLIKEIARKKDVTKDKKALLKKLYLLGTYVKRRCNLQLIEKEKGFIPPEDLALSVQDIERAMKQCGIDMTLPINPEGIPSKISINRTNHPKTGNDDNNSPGYISGQDPAIRFFDAIESALEEALNA